MILLVVERILSTAPEEVVNGGRSHGGRWSFWRAFSRTEFVEIVPKKKALIEAMEKAGKGYFFSKPGGDPVGADQAGAEFVVESTGAFTDKGKAAAHLKADVIYELCAAFRSLEVRHFDLLPEKGFEVDLDAIAALEDQNSEVLW
ncbi:hypothetical protein OIU85_017264 [Salix viminalis]|uniref:Uncharacterized protein n=1 Tax=Salix viminalis TaxID=40686 RepID=A0A9Q0V7A4_SALVM|nr:hypothetical protein OIU85_017264 [Salix viminalis]